MHILPTPRWLAKKCQGKRLKSMSKTDDISPAPLHITPIHQMIQAGAVRQMQSSKYPGHMHFFIGVQHLQWNLMESHIVWSLSLLVFWKLGAMETGPVWWKINSIRWTSSMLQSLLARMCFKSSIRMMKNNDELWRKYDAALLGTDSWSAKGWWSSIFTTFT